MSIEEVRANATDVQSGAGTLPPFVSTKKPGPAPARVDPPSSTDEGLPSVEASPSPFARKEAFARELLDLRKELEASIGPEDLEHLRKMQWWGRGCSALGYATAWIAPNPISALLIAQGNTARWTMVTHHIAHRGYDRVPDVPEHQTGRGFAVGWRRFLDWPDWIHPDAWRHEHNALHHGNTGETSDPDLVEENMEWLRQSDLPLVAKHAIVAFFACTWKLTYYAPNTFLEWRRVQRRRAGEQDDGTPIRLISAFDPFTEEGRSFWATCVLPYAGLRFGALPALFSPLGPWAVGSVFLNSVFAEVLTNIQSFILIGPNHAGEDLYRFEGRAKSHSEFSVRQVIGSVNYATGSDVVDFFHGFLNYQIEHHLWPHLPMRQYQRAQPRVKAICEKYGVPYVQEGVLRRAKKMVDIMVGRASMRTVDPAGAR
ncbi:fatty acid desaturase family protein [Chondromyces crocatus]|uniref:Fatty acid desaturase n=1 Tax=Chondromyces crocatus TaxID=52 RepID=A0A0K1EJW4_CHOCO|nr:fatty acid desaturase [Chondromyces crocatus]AKT41151.1 fatty acid desaturase [Chondromyces crocatus]